MVELFELLLLVLLWQRNEVINNSVQNNLKLITIGVEPYFIGLWFNVVDVVAYDR